jgi:hypothetical protein
VSGSTSPEPTPSGGPRSRVHVDRRLRVAAHQRSAATGHRVPWESSISGGIQYAILLDRPVVDAGLDRWNFSRCADRGPGSAAGSSLVIFTVFVVTAVVAQFGNADKEQD